MSRLDLKVYDNKSKKNKTVGFMELKNSTNQNAELFIYGDIVSDSWGKWSDEDTCPQDITDFLKEVDKFKDINIHVNSGGGSVFGGLAIYNQLKRHNGTKTVYIDGLAASIASVIACAGDRIVIPKNAQFMIHKPLCWCGGNADDLRKQADVLDTCQSSILSVYMDNVKEGVTEEEISNLINAETWFTGETVTNYFNFEVEEAAEAVACASDYLNKYKNTPKDLNTKSFFNAQNSEIPQMDDETKAMIERINQKKNQWNL